MPIDLVSAETIDLIDVVNVVKEDNSSVSLNTGQDVNPVSANTSKISVRVLSPLQKSGIELSKLVLYIISGYIVFLIAFFLIDTFRAPNEINIGKALTEPALSDSAFAHRLELIKAAHEQSQHSKAFVKDITQMVLLNLLLPTLTAILGYIFGTREGENAGNNAGAS